MNMSQDEMMFLKILRGQVIEEIKSLKRTLRQAEPVKSATKEDWIKHSKKIRRDAEKWMFKLRFIVKRRMDGEPLSR